VPFGELQRIMVRRLLIEVHLPEAGDRCNSQAKGRSTDYFSIGS
jgi:hypothetical protein